jgi:hypothetical protein
MHPIHVLKGGLLVYCALVLAAPAPGQRVLSYVERSTGLSQPGLEGGGTELEFADLNGDGNPDLVSVGDHGNPGIAGGEHGIMVWFGNGSGAWSFYQTGDLGYGGIAVGDVNGDGLMDVGYGIHHNYSSTDLGNQILEVALGDGTGHQWTAWDDGLATSGEDWGMFGTDFADVDNDGDLDVGSISFGCCAGIHVYRNNGNGTWTQTFGILGGNSSLEFVFGDVNGDGNPDFAASHGSGTVYLGDGAGNFTLADGNLPSGPWRSGISLGDVDDDGRDELSFRTSSGVYVYKWVSSGQWQSLSGSLSTISGVYLTQIADMNLDGHGDIIAMSLGQTRIYTGDGQGQWQLAATVTSPATCDYAALRGGTDIDHNGYPDFAFVAEENCDPWTGGTNTLRCFAESSIPSELFVYPKRPRGGEVWQAGSVQFLDWHAAVPAGAGQPSMTIELSIHGPDGPFSPLASAVPNSGRVQVCAPGDSPTSTQCYLRYTLATDPPTTVVTPGAFSLINPDPPDLGDLNCDGLINGYDIDPFVLALTNTTAYGLAHPWCDPLLADINGDGAVNGYDIDPFVLLLTGGS